MASAVQGSEASTGSGAIPGQLSAAAAPPAVAYPNIGDGEFRRQRGPVDVALLSPCLPDGVVQVADNYRYNTLQPRSGAGRGEVLVDLVTVPDGEVFVAPLPGGIDAVYEHDNSADYAWQVCPAAGRGEVFLGALPDVVGVVFDNSANLAQQALLGTGRADGTAGALRDPILGAGYDGSVGMADDLGAGYGNRGVVAGHLRRLFPFAGIGACSVAVNGLAAGPGSPAVAFHLFALLLGGMFLIMQHMLRV